MIQPRLGFSQLVVVFVLHSRGENENENQNENQNASSYENTMEARVICMEAEPNQVQKAEDDKVTKKLFESDCGRQWLRSNQSEGLELRASVESE